MIDGIVNDAYQPIVRLSLQGPGGQQQEIDAIVDTGYNGLLTLPSSVVTRLDLPIRSSGVATLGDGSAVSFDVYGVTVFWDGNARDIEADESESVPLVGMLLMDGHDLSIRVREGGRVIIQAAE